MLHVTASTSVIQQGIVMSKIDMHSYLPASKRAHSYGVDGRCVACGFDGATHVSLFLQAKALGRKEFPRVPSCVSPSDSDWRERMRLIDLESQDSSIVLDYVVREVELTEGLFDFMFST